uniref:Docking protein 2 n=1 Tax=Seriola dumerili TaxID=41447 RepID=A0A3B4UEC9_SERDU
SFLMNWSVFKSAASTVTWTLRESCLQWSMCVWPLCVCVCVCVCVRVCACVVRGAALCQCVTSGCVFARTEASERCRLKGDVLLRRDVVFTWPYRYLRRFGRDKSTFSFERGECESGEGSFEFDTKQGNFLFQAVEAAIQPAEDLPPPQADLRGGLASPDIPQAADGVYSMVTEHHKDKESSTPSQQQTTTTTAPLDKALTGVKSLTWTPAASPPPRKNQVKMISSCPLPHANPLQPMERRERNKPGSPLHPSSDHPPEPEYSLPFDTINKNIDGCESSGDPLYDSISTSEESETSSPRPEGCAATAGASGGQKSTGPPSVYDDPEEMRGDAWRIMGTAADPKGHEYPYNPRVGRLRRAKRPREAIHVTNEEEEEDNEDNGSPRRC